jgi:diguanylate cyclase (GGDEF)-like protein
VSTDGRDRGVDGATAEATGPRTPYLIGVAVPIALIAVILALDAIESPKTAYVGVLCAIPMLSAVFAPPVATGGVAVVTWMSALTFGWLASDGNVQAQRVRLVFIATFGVIAVAASAVRVQRERRLTEALTLAAEAEHQRVRATTDPLTGLTNRRGLMEDVAGRAAGETCVAMVDLDDMKTVNDEHGHLVGDEFIRGVAGRLRANLAGVDTVCRWGGDEFVVVLELDAALAETVLRRVVTSVTAEPVATSAGPLRANLSVGVTPWLVGEDADAAISRADRAMYGAKGTDGSHVVAVLEAT